MRFKITLNLLIISLVSFFKISAQTTVKTETEVKSLTKYKIYLLGTGFEREQKISATSSLIFGAAVETVVPFHPMMPANASDVLRLDYSVNLAPVLSLGFRNYYNFTVRAEKMKTTDRNSGSYIGMEYNLITPILINKRYTTNYVHSISPVWGFQKNTSKNINLELAAGPSFQTDFNKNRVSLLARLGLNYLL